MNRLLRYKNKKGFTLAEVMMAVAIIVILAGVSFVGVTGYLRSMALLERDSIAKEIFIAAQNHLTMAKGQGYLGLVKAGADGKANTANYGTEDTSTETKGDYYVSVNNASQLNADTLIQAMLPFGAIDETVRGAGSYIIRYNPDQATVLDVFYCSQNGSRYDDTLGDIDKVGSKADYEKKSYRKNFHDGKVLGWFGGEDAANLTVSTNAVPTLKLVNDDVLYAEISLPSTTTDTNSKHQVYLYVEGVTSGASGYLIIDDESSSIGSTFIAEGSNLIYKVILDDITTSNRHFSQIKSFKEGNRTFVSDSSSDVTDFIPGEDIKVYATLFDNSTLSDIAKSAVKTTNSLFGDLMPVTEDSTSYPEISIGSMRHLENLDNRVSAFAPTSVVSEAAKVVAKQTTDLEWNEFLPSETATDNDDKTPSANTVYYNITAESNDSTKEKCYLPVSPSYTLEYDGDSHSISNVKVDYEGSAGLIGTMTKGSVSNLELIDFNITGTGAAGALAGKMTESTVVNVLAHNSSASASTNIISAASAGGLIGSAEKCTVRVSAASLIVSSSGGDAGGLIGTVSGTDSSAVIGCYSGGHLDTSTHEYSSTTFNVTGSGAAGGLIGNAGAASIQYSYSTCSASGATVGGFIGSGSGTIGKCYATGLVKKAGTTTNYEQVGAFAGTYNGTEITDCSYYEIINETKDPDGKYTGLLKAVNNGDNSNITPFDKTMAIFQAFIPEEWADAYPYDEMLEKYFGDKYNLKTVEQLSSPAPTLTQLAGKTVSGGNLDTTDYYVAKHYGDWPSPEVQVVNETETENG